MRPPNNRMRSRMRALNTHLHLNKLTHSCALGIRLTVMLGSVMHSIQVSLKRQDAIQSIFVINTVTLGSTKWRKGIIPTHSRQHEAVKVNKVSQAIQKMITRNASFILLMFTY